MSNPFDEAKAWVPTQMLPKGMHRVFVRSALATRTRDYGKGTKAMVSLELGNNDGNVRDWITLQVPNSSVKGSSIGIQQIVAVFDAAGVYRPRENEFDPSDMAISQSALNRLGGREVGIYVDHEEREVRNDETGGTEIKTFAVVNGYVPATEIAAGPTYGAGTPNTGGYARMAIPATPSVPAMSAAPAADDDDIPFHHLPFPDSF